MPGFETAGDMHKSMSFWLISRSIIATTLLGLAFDPEDSEISQMQSYGVLSAGLLATLGWGILVFAFPNLIPLTFIQEPVRHRSKSPAKPH
jgi:hypothetical protein